MPQKMAQRTRQPRTSERRCVRVIKCYCDYCKKEIESSNEQVNLDFNAFGCTNFPTNKEYQFHIECATRVQNKLEVFLNQKGGAE